MTPEQQAESVGDRPGPGDDPHPGRAVAEGTEFADRDIELVEIGILASASEMLTLLDEVGLRRRSP